MKVKINLIIAITLITLTGCVNSGEEHTIKDSPPHSDHKWNYSGETGPQYWEKLESNNDCGGLHQSPVNIIDLNTVSGNIVNGIQDIHYSEIDTIKSISNNGHTIQYNFNGDNNIISYEGNNYKMIQFHFHSPSEHTIDGVRYPMEIHAVHHSEELDSYIVFAALVKQGEPDPTFTFLEKHLPIDVGETKDINATYSFGSTIQDLFGLDSMGVYTYNGSLTTPPCTEKVLWIVMKNANSASAEQINLLQSLMPLNNYREVQPLNGRKIFRETLSD